MRQTLQFFAAHFALHPVYHYCVSPLDREAWRLGAAQSGGCKGCGGSLPNQVGGKPPCSIAADKFGLDDRDVHRAAKRVPGLLEAHLRAWGEWWGAALPKMWEHHLEGLRKC